MHIYLLDCQNTCYDTSHEIQLQSQVLKLRWAGCPSSHSYPMVSRSQSTTGQPQQLAKHEHLEFFGTPGSTLADCPFRRVQLCQFWVRFGLHLCDLRQVFSFYATKASFLPPFEWLRILLPNLQCLEQQISGPYRSSRGKNNICSVLTSNMTPNQQIQVHHILLHALNSKAATMSLTDRICSRISEVNAVFFAFTPVTYIIHLVHHVHHSN